MNEWKITIASVDPETLVTSPTYIVRMHGDEPLVWAQAHIVWHTWMRQNTGTLSRMSIRPVHDNELD